MTYPEPSLLGFFAPPAWTEEALCAQVDVDIFFPERGDEGGSLSQARRVCSLCDVRDECLEYALSYESGERGIDRSYSIAGVWGGTTPNERKKILRERDREAA